MKPILKEFASETTCHGWKYVGDSKSSIFVRLIWLSVVLALLFGLSYTLIKTYLAYQEHRVLTVTQTERREEIPFPAVTLCNRGKYDNSSGYITEDIANYILSYAGKTYDWSTKDSKNIANLSVADFIKSTAFDWSRIISGSRVGYDLINFTDMETIDTEEGRCLIINGPQYVASNGRLKLKEMGSERGLILDLVTFQESYVPTMTLDAGFELFLHEPHETIRPRSGGILLSPGTNNLISLKPVEYKLLPYPYKSHGKEYCLEEDDEKFKHINTIYGYKSYSRDSCLRDCTANVTVHTCGCKTLLETGKVFEDIQRYCTMYEVHKCYLDEFIKNTIKVEKGELCDCSWSCRQVTYETKLSNTLYPSKIGVDYINKIYKESMTVEDARNNFLKVHIFFNDLFYTEIKHVPEFDLDAIFGRVGGQMGLFLGASLVSAFELCVYLVKLFWNGVQARGNHIKNINIQPVTEKQIPN